MGSLFLVNPPVTRLSPRFHFKSNQNRSTKTNFAVLRRGARCAANMTTDGDGSYSYGNTLKFPRMNVWDPYKRLGIMPDASEEEIWGARNFLLEQYAGHESSMESIEASFEKLFMNSFVRRKKTKMNLKSRLRNKIEESPSWVKRFVDWFELPPVDVILRRLFLFGFMAVWSVVNSADAGPAFQVALSLASSIYFLNDKIKDVKKAIALGFGSLVLGWFVGSIVVPLIPATLLRPTWTLELLTSLFCFFSLFFSCTFLK
ncbi:Heat shock protein DnaJ domain protein [Zostera marina]|uniref:Heat shock protein DnaJ domain protein n=1 Tax=Zostera marina TaxID=29655 RepID=A0A0K9NYU6_ZOSMR|nr:Heat shock protein DnaJ domain protein [Zostera marina]